MRYSLPRIAKEFGLEYITVYKRATSKYAKYRWGIEEVVMPDGNRRFFVPQNKIYLWVENSDLRGKPSKEELERYENKK